jgi:hypothetical protein
MIPHRFFWGQEKFIGKTGDFMKQQLDFLKFKENLHII